jgi:L-iditol 2-dehydrogenase
VVLHAPRRMEVRAVPDPAPGPGEVVVQVEAVGLCGSDYHVWTGEANYHFDAAGRPIPLERAPQILGHEIVGVVAAAGAGADLRAGQRVLVDQGLNCASRGRAPAERCEYCASGHTHQCADYAELGITGLPGGLAEAVRVPAANCLPRDAALPARLAVVAEPLACVLHALEMTAAARTRWQLGAAEPQRRVNAVLIAGAGTAGLLFAQALRRACGYDGLLLISEPDPRKRALAERWGAIALDPAAADLGDQVAERTQGRRLEMVIEASGAGRVFEQLPRLIRKQATVLLYGYGHAGASLEALNPLHWFEPALVAPTGASGALAADGRPEIYRRALTMLERGVVDAAPLVTEVHRGLAAVPAAFEQWGRNPDSIKGVVELS